METTIIKGGELGITDTLYYEIFKNLTKENIEEIVKRRAKAILNMKDDKGKYYYGIEKGDNRKFKVTGTFTIIDFMLNKRGVLLAYMDCQRNGDNVDVVVNSTTYKEL